MIVHIYICNIIFNIQVLLYDDYCTNIEHYYIINIELSGSMFDMSSSYWA